MRDTCKFQFFNSFGSSLVIIKNVRSQYTVMSTWDLQNGRNPCWLQEQEKTVRTGGGIAGPNQNHNVSIVPPLAVILDAAGHQAHSHAVLEQTVFCCEGGKAPQVVIPIIIHYHISIAHRWTQLSDKNLQFAYIVVHWASRCVLNKHWIIYSSLYHSPLLKSPKGTRCTYICHSVLIECPLSLENTKCKKENCELNY